MRKIASIRIRCAVVVFAAVAAASVVIVWARDDATYPLRFDDVTAEAGLDKPLAGIMGHGGAWGDYDGDGRFDLFVGGFCDRPNDEYAPAAGPVAPKLLRQVEPGRFVVADEPAASRYARTSGALFVDLDNDGSPELYISNNARPQTKRDAGPQHDAQLQRSVLLTRRNGKLVDITESSGACPEGLLSARNVVPLDYDRDGLLDLLVIEDRFIGKKTPHTVLLHNVTGKDGLKFEVANDAQGLPDGLFGLGAAVADLNDDGRPDLFIPHSNRMFITKGDGTYEEPESLRETFMWRPLDGEDWPCGASFGDLNGDGRLDLVVSLHSVHARNKVYINETPEGGEVRFRDVTDVVGLGATVPVRCPHVELRDFDNDGRLDIYLSAAWRDGDKVTPLIFWNTGNGGDGLPRFAPPRAITDSADGMAYYPAGPTVDFDGDGMLDIFLVNWFAGDRCHLLRNATKPRGNWLKVSVIGKKTLSRDGIGAKVRVYRAGNAANRHALIAYHEVAAGYGYASGQVPECQIGLGYRDTVDVMITLPDGRTLTRLGVKTNQRIVIEEPQ